MAEFIEVLKTTPGECAEFTVDISQPSVPLLTCSGFTEALLSTSSGWLKKSVFTRGDNIIVLSAGIIVPESFVMSNQTSTATCDIRFFGKKRSDNTYISMEQMGVNGIFSIPFINYELSIGVFVDAESWVGDDYELMVKLPEHNVNFPSISMINVPSDLDNKTFFVDVFVKVLHNIPLKQA